MNHFKSNYPWVLCNLGGNIYGIACKYIVSIASLNEVNNIPDVPNFIRGITNLRNEIIHMFDLRIMLGLKSVQEEIVELVEMLDARKVDHVNWLTDLMNSVKENKEFKLTIDPHACAFGKWYDSFKTDDYILQDLLKKFDKPHKKIHSIGYDVKQLEEKGDFFVSTLLINNTENNELKEMINLFEALIEEYRESRREIVIALNNGKKTLGIIVDEVISVETLLEDNGRTTDFALDKTVNLNLSLGIGKRRKDSKPVILIKDEYFFNLQY